LELYQYKRVINVSYARVKTFNFQTILFHHRLAHQHACAGPTRKYKTWEVANTHASHPFLPRVDWAGRTLYMLQTV